MGDLQKSLGAIQLDEKLFEAKQEDMNDENKRNSDNFKVCIIVLCIYLLALLMLLSTQC